MGIFEERNGVRENREKGQITGAESWGRGTLRVVSVDNFEQAGTARQEKCDCAV